MLNYLKLICSFLVLFSCSDTSPKKSQIIKSDLKNNFDSITIEEVIAKLDNSGVVKPEKIEGDFAYYNSQDNIYKSVFVTDNEKLEIRYHHYGNENILDTLFVSNDFFALPKFEKQDPLTIEVHEFMFQDKSYLVLTSRAISASGSGVNLRYFTVFEHKGLKVRNVYFFNSRFGVAEFIGDYDSDEELDFLKVSRLENDKFSVFIQAIGKKISPSSSNEILTTLKYLGEDKFEQL